MRPWIRRSILWLGLALCLYAVWQAHAHIGDEVRRIDAQTWILLSVLLGLSWFLAVAAWRQYLAAYTGDRAAWRLAVRQIGILLVGKYVPTGVFGFVARLYDEPGARRGPLLWAGIAEQSIGVAMPVCFGGLLLLLAHTGHPAWIALVPVLPAFALGGLLILHRVAGRIPLLRRYPNGPEPGRLRALQAAALQLGVQVAWAGAILVLVSALFGVDPYAACGVAGAFGLAIAAGMLVVFVPGGIGVREAVLIGLAAPWLGTSQALFVAGLLRIFSTVVDLVGGAAAALLGSGEDSAPRTSGDRG
ncbi:lysylphosphatidylglycerol synthase domain-containing protein [uncultured Luteimonas sp.]|uniref:lysylphosphatidylglycerol synthase domain-containing protein n=1 Tax=uncultured Luteimonas sp. TaxID=453144 RepID=UPI00262CA87F|nr:lysylphosphatidylglycerol synthase domain-containing protein [uncultured Luteimonas sp.]